MLFPAPINKEVSCGHNRRAPCNAARKKKKKKKKKTIEKLLKIGNTKKNALISLAKKMCLVPFIGLPQ
jgi:hypothetical protein